MNDLTKGSVTKHIVSLSGAMAAGMVFQSLYFFVDLWFISKLGKEANAGVGLAGNLMMVVLAASQMLGIGTTTLIAHAVGRKDQPRAEKVFNQSFIFSLLLGALFLMSVLIFRDAYASTAADPLTKQRALEYMRWFLPGLGLQFALISIGAALRGTGVVKPTMIVQMLTVVLNIILAPILIAGWGTGVPLGVAGAGLATFISIVVAIVVMVLYFIKLETHVNFDRKQWSPDFKVWGDILGIGIPAGGEFLLIGVYSFLIYSVINRFGSAAQAGFGTGVRIMQMLFVPVMAISFAASPVAGQNFGARSGERVRQTFKSAALITVSIMILLTALAHLVPDKLVAIFLTDQAAIAFGSEYFRMVSWNFAASGLIFVISAMFQSMGNSWPPLFSSAVRLTLFMVAILWMASRPDFAIIHVWQLSVASVLLQALVNLTLLYREFGRKLTFNIEPDAVEMEPNYPEL